MGQKVAINWGGGVLARFFFFSRGGALLEEASAFKKYFEPGPRPARVAINQRGFINQELTLLVHFAAVAEVLHKFCFNRGPHV